VEGVRWKKEDGRGKREGRYEHSVRYGGT